MLKTSYKSIIKDNSIVKRTKDLCRFFIKKDLKNG